MAQANEGRICSLPVEWLHAPELRDSERPANGVFEGVIALLLLHILRPLEQRCICALSGHLKAQISVHGAEALVCQKVRNLLDAAGQCWPRY